ncbi:MAG: radical SAM protein [Bacteroides sp.]
MITFGPVPSRRLGKSLGINNIPSMKVCSYECIYCQVGETKKQIQHRISCYKPITIYNSVKTHLEKVEEVDKPDFLTFVANGEPTLDLNLGETIELLKDFSIPIAIITNASMLFNPDVRRDLMQADWVSVKVDSATEWVWRKINSPLLSANFDNQLNGILNFSTEFKGKLVTETMLVSGVNDTEDSILKTARFIAKLNASLSYLSVPTRPPFLKTVKASDENAITMAYQSFSNHGLSTELLLGYEGTHTGFTGNAMEDILSICSVHPLREDALYRLLEKDKADSIILDILLQTEAIQKVEYNSETFYVRKFKF